jgi:hypothetical protein
MDMAYKMYAAWINQAEDNLRGLWYRTNLSFWLKNEKPMATIRWAAFDLDVASFNIPDSFPEDEKLNDWKVDQQLFWSEEDGKPVIVYDKDKPRDKFKEKVAVPEAIDAFLGHEWTPPWCCTSCRKRYNKTVKPL